jgi:peptidoglycan/xylan/chitin deacetylase (PgdA/CDA1 family)
MKTLVVLFTLLNLGTSFGAIDCESIKRKYTCSNGATYPIHLTFDDGPAPGRTELVLAALDKHNVSATFFVNGDRLTPNGGNGNYISNIKTLRKIIDSGNPIGSHGFHHVHHSKMSKSKLLSEIERAKNAGVGIVVDGVRQGKFLTKPLLFRLPYGDGWHPLTHNKKNKDQVMEALKEAGFSHVGWPHNGSSRGLHISDWNRNKDHMDLLLKRICEFKGGIVLMHDVQPHTAKGIDHWISAVKCLGHPLTSIDSFLNDGQSVQLCEGAESLDPPKVPSEMDSILDIFDHVNETEAR